MNLLETPKRLLSLAETLHRWSGLLAALDRPRRAKVVRYAETIADTLGRAARFAVRLAEEPGDRMAERRLIRELGRITGYIETLVGVLKHHLDGRKLAGVKRRLEQLGSRRAGRASGGAAARVRIDRLLAAEGYFRALADSLRV